MFMTLIVSSIENCYHEHSCELIGAPRGTSWSTERTVKRPLWLVELVVDCVSSEGWTLDWWLSSRAQSSNCFWKELLNA